MLKIAAIRVGFMICMMQIMFSYPGFSQDNSAYVSARESLVSVLKNRFIDKDFTQHIDGFYYRTCDSMIKKGVAIEDCPITDILVKLFTSCKNKINNKSITSLRIPAVNNYFLLTIKRYKKQAINDLFREIDISQTAILQSAFDGLMLGDSIKTFLGLREMLNVPYYITIGLHQPAYAGYQDTLLYYLANSAPEILAYRLSNEDSFYSALVNRSNSRTIQAVSAIQIDEYFGKVLPFSLAIYEKRVSIDSIRELSLWPSHYYEAFVEEALRLHKSADPEISAFLKQPIATINKGLANQYYIEQINDLHESPDKIRFAIIRSLSPKALYFILVADNDDLYTSSFLYVYKKFLSDTKKHGLNRFFEEIGYYQFDQFLSNISVYGLVQDLARHFKGARFPELLTNYLATLQNAQLKDKEIILNSMEMSEVVEAVSQYPDVSKVLVAELKKVEKPALSHDMLLSRIYAGFLDILERKNKYIRDKTYDVLPAERLKNNGAIVQVWFFYDDDDGAISFSSGTAIFDEKVWKKTDAGNYVLFEAMPGNTMKVFMNKPNTRVGYDSAQREMLHVIRRHGFEPTSVIHRGHSYHVDHSLEMMSPSAQLVFLGSCGGTNEVLEVFRKNPDVNVIVTRHIGSRVINDQMLAVINTKIAAGRDIEWDVLWREFYSMFRSRAARDLFSSYVAPNKYTGVKFIRNVFNY